MLTIKKCCVFMLDQLLPALLQTLFLSISRRSCTDKSRELKTFSIITGVSNKVEDFFKINDANCNMLMRERSVVRYIVKSCLVNNLKFSIAHGHGSWMRTTDVERWEVKRSSLSRAEDTLAGN